MDVELKDVPELIELDIKTDYYTSGKVKTVGSYRKDGTPEGLRKEFSEEGKITESYVFLNGAVIGVGVVDNSNLKQGEWKEYHPSGRIEGEGKYEDGNRIGEWKFYHENGQLEQKGSYIKGAVPHGKWVWYHDNGQMWRTEVMNRGKEDGPVTEYDEGGNVLLEGMYSDGSREGQWTYTVGDYSESGEYANGQMVGKWKGVYANGKTAFEGSYLDGAPDGKFSWYYETGQLKEQGRYIMGRKEGEWTKYDETGLVYLIITFKNGLELDINGVKIKPEHEERDIEIIY
jgi:uncharacterized protein